MLKRFVIILCIVIGFIENSNSQIPVTIKNKYIDSLYYRNNTKWITLTPFFLTNQEFSVNQGENWQKIGMFGGNVKPYLMSDSIARQNINLYKLTRTAGIVQMWVIAPLLAYKHYTYDPNDIESTGNSVLDDNIEREQGGGYLTASIIIFITGNLTYHFLSKTFLYRSLHDLNHGILNKESPISSLKFNFKIDQSSQTPQLSFIVSF